MFKDDSFQYTTPIILNVYICLSENVGLSAALTYSSLTSPMLFLPDLHYYL